MQGPIRCVLVAGMLYGCDTRETTPQPDAEELPGDSGLLVEWSSSPAAWPSNTSGVTLERARFSMKSLRVVGDAGPGDPRTTASAVEMGFAWTGPEQRPPSIPFDDAPPGLYSQIALAFDAAPCTNCDRDVYELRGSVEVEGDTYEFRIEDENQLNFNVAIDEMLGAGEQATIHLRINFMNALDAVDWQNVDVNDGRKELRNGDSQMSIFRTKLVDSFEIVGIDTAR